MSEPPEPAAPLVTVANEQVDRVIEADRWRRLAHDALVDEGVTSDGELALHFVDEAAISDLNRRFMDEDGPTDVLAFPLDVDDLPPVASARHRAATASDPADRVPGSPGNREGGPPVLLGDIVICPTVAASNADAHGRNLDDEIALLVIHGILHVLGHDHREADEAAVMRARETVLLDRHHRGRR